MTTACAMIAVLLVSSAVAGENRIRPCRDVLHAALKPVPGFALDECNLLHGDQLDRIVSWKANTDVRRRKGGEEKWTGRSDPLLTVAEAKNVEFFASIAVMKGSDPHWPRRTSVLCGGRDRSVTGDGKPVSTASRYAESMQTRGHAC